VDPRRRPHAAPSFRIENHLSQDTRSEYNFVIKTTMDIEKEGEKQNGDPATDKQKRFLKKLEIEFVPNLTKVQASALIDRALAKEQESVS